MALDFPDSPNDGQVFSRFTYESSKGVWRARDAAVAPGGTIDFPDIPSNGDIYSGFTYDSISETWKNKSNILPSGYPFEYLVVAGGGGGGTSPGGYASGGGGAGGVATDTIYVDPSTFTVTVGAGGSNTTNGYDSIFSVVTSKGGTRGGNLTANGGNLNGGACGSPTAFAGGSGSDFEGGGGGGASEVGAFGGPNNSGAGGDGVSSNITGSTVYYGGGGGGGNSTIFGRGGAAGTGGLGGGGNGGKNYTAGSGTANTGGGGGGAGFDGSSYTGGSGGSGVVILKYPIGATVTIGGGLTSSTVTSGDYKITSFTAGSDTVTVI